MSVNEILAGIKIAKSRLSKAQDALANNHDKEMAAQDLTLVIDYLVSLRKILGADL